MTAGRRRAPRTPEQRLAQWSKSIIPGTLSGGLANASPIIPGVTSGRAQSRSIGAAFGGGPGVFKRDRFSLTGATPTLTLTYLPVTDSPHVYLNGLEQDQNVDYTISGQTITILAAAGAISGDIVDVRYAYSSDAPATVAGIGVVTDDFNRADSSTSLGAATTGQSWSALAGVWGISSNKAYKASAAGQHFAVIDCGAADVTVSVTLSGTTTNTGGLCWRATDANNVWFVELSSTGFTTYNLQGGGLTNYGATAVTFAAGDVMSVVLSGTSMNIRKNGVIVRTITDTFNVSATKHGLRDFSGVLRFDDFSVAS